MKNPITSKEAHEIEKFFEIGFKLISFYDFLTKCSA